MKTKLMAVGMSVTILALATPVYAGHLGGGLGGGFGGTLGNGLGAGGGFASRGGLDDSVNPTDTRAVRQSADKANGKTGTAAQAAGAAAGSTNANARNVAASAGSDVQGEAAKSAAGAASEKSSSASTPAKPASTTPTSASRSKPAASTSLGGTSDETLHAGGRDVSGSGTGSVGADHSPGSNSVEASATGSGSQH